MKFRSPTDEPVYLGLTSGHTVVVPREGVELDAKWNKTAIANGCIPGTLTDEEAALLAAGDAAAASVPGFDRHGEITKVLTKMLDMSEEGLFRQDGRPDMRKVNAMLGFQAERTEIDKAWDELAESLQGDKADSKQSGEAK